MRTLMANYGFDPDRVIVSVQKDNPNPEYTSESAGCNSFYGDSAMLLHLSEVLESLQGRYFGNAPKAVPANGLPCNNASISYLDAIQIMSQSPISHPKPAVVDVHSQINYPNNLMDTAQWAVNFHSRVWDLLSTRGMTGSRVVFGEANPVEPNCTEWTPEQANAVIFGYAGVGGYKKSLLYSNAKANVVMSSWHRTEEVGDHPPWSVIPT